MSDLPDSWCISKIGSVSAISTGTTPPTKDLANYGGDTPFVKPGDLDAREAIVFTTSQLSEQGATQARIVRKGAVLISCIGNLGKVGVAGRPLATNQQINTVEFDESVVTDRFGLHFCKTLKPWLEQESSATTISIINKSKFSEAPIVIAPLPEQKRIADKLDSLLTRIDACRNRLDRLPAIIKQFRQSVLAAATSGMLTEEWHVNQSKPDATETTLGKLIRVSSGKFLPTKNMAENGAIPVYGGNGVNGHHSKANVSEETLVIGRVGFYCGCVHMTPEQAWVTDNALIVRHDQNVVSRRYLFFALQAMDLRENDSSTAQPVISGQKIYSLPILVPCLDEQTEIVRRVESLFAFAERLEARVKTARARVDTLTPATLAKAFRGELVPQDPNDEPARVLLERIRAEKEATPSSRSKGKRRNSSQTATNK